MFLFILLGLD